jgi:hypothetical protein
MQGPPAFDPGLSLGPSQEPGGSFWDRIALGLADLPDYHGRPGEPGSHRFFGNLISGAAHSYSKNRMADMARREKLEAAFKEDAKQRNAANLKATKLIRPATKIAAKTASGSETVPIGGHNVSVNSRLGQRIVSRGTPYETKPTPARPRQGPTPKKDKSPQQAKMIFYDLHHMPDDLEKARARLMKIDRDIEKLGLREYPGMADSMISAGLRIKAMSGAK